VIQAKDMEPLQLLTTDGKDVWQVQWICLEPSYKVKNLLNGEELSGGQSGLNFQDFKKLVPLEGK